MSKTDIRVAVYEERPKLDALEEDIETMFWSLRRGKYTPGFGERECTHDEIVAFLDFEGIPEKDKPGYVHLFETLDTKYIMKKREKQEQKQKRDEQKQKAKSRRMRPRR